jgi:hypothetical protein
MIDITQEKLQKMTVPAVSMKSHQVHLKQALLAASYPTDKITKRRWSIFMTKKKFMLSGLTMTFAALVILVISVITILSPVSAEELTQQSLNKVTQLSPAQEQQLEKRVNADPKAELQAAKAAKDLKILTYEQFQQLMPQANTISAHDPNDSSPGPSTLNPASLKYLRYTSADGATHIIGVGNDGLPVLIMTFKQNSDGSAVPAPNCQTFDNGEVTCSASATTQTTKP